MKKGFFVLIVVLLAFFLVTQKESSVQKTYSLVSKENKTAQIRENQKSISKSIQNLSLKIEHLHENPSEVELELKTFAQQLSVSEFQNLQSIALDLNANQDQRFLAVTLLAFSNQIEAAQFLSAIAMTPIDPLLMTDFEKIVRLRAVEGLGEIPLNSSELMNSLDHIVSVTDESLIIDRAERLKWAYQNHSLSPEEQDQVALRKLLGY